MASVDYKSRVSERIWRSIAESNVPLSSIPQEQLKTLVDAIADGVIDVLREMSAEVGSDWDATAETADELTLWSGRPFLSLVERYTVTSERVRIRTGLLNKKRENVELVRIQDIDYRQSLGERILGIGDVHLHSSDPSEPELSLRNVRRPEFVHDVIRRAMLAARRRYRFSFQDEM